MNCGEREEGFAKCDDVAGDTREDLLLPEGDWTASGVEDVGEVLVARVDDDWRIIGGGGVLMRVMGAQGER